MRAELALALESRGQRRRRRSPAGSRRSRSRSESTHLLERSTHELSGGEKQRVALGAALAGRPRLVLLDEPTSQLDPVAGDELIGLLRRLNQEWETTILLAEHRLERCLAAADRVIALDGGPCRLRWRSRVGFLEWAAEARARPADPGGAAVRAAPGCSRRRPASSRPRDAPRRRVCCRLSADRASRPRRRRPGPGRSARAGRAPGRGASLGAPPEPGARPARRLARAARRAGDPARRRPRAAARRERRADGPQRRRQVDAPAPRRRADGAHARARAAGGTGRAAAAEPRRLLHPRARRRRGLAAALAAVGLAGMAERNPKRPLRRRAPAPRARDRHRRRGEERSGRARARRAHARDGPRREGRLARRSGAAPSRARP